MMVLDIDIWARSRAMTTKGDPRCSMSWPCTKTAAFISQPCSSTTRCWLSGCSKSCQAARNNSPDCRCSPFFAVVAGAASRWRWSCARITSEIGCDGFSQKPFGRRRERRILWDRIGRRARLEPVGCPSFGFDKVNNMYVVTYVVR